MDSNHRLPASKAGTLTRLSYDLSIWMGGFEPPTPRIRIGYSEPN